MNIIPNHIQRTSALSQTHVPVADGKARTTQDTGQPEDGVSGSSPELNHPWWYNLKYLVVGVVFGIVFVKSEIVAWYRIQEMFRFQSFHMYGVMATAVLVAMCSIWCIKKFKVKTIHGEPIRFYKKTFTKGQVIGGLLFGFGWAMTGACPGPLFAQIGMGYLVVLVVLGSAVAGTWVYGLVRERLPH